MKVEKAIEILELNVAELGKKMPPDCRDAVNLGIESLRREIQHRQMSKSWQTWLLPGETKE